MSTQESSPSRTLGYAPHPNTIPLPDHDYTMPSTGDTRRGVGIATSPGEVARLLTPEGPLDTPAKRFWHEIESSALANGRLLKGTKEPDLRGLSMHFGNDWQRTFVIADQYKSRVKEEKRQRGRTPFKLRNKIFQSGHLIKEEVDNREDVLTVEEYSSEGVLLLTHTMSKDEFVRFAQETKQWDRQGAPKGQATHIWWAEAAERPDNRRSFSVELPKDKNKSVFEAIVKKSEDEDVNLVGLTWNIGSVTYTVRKDDRVIQHKYAGDAGTDITRGVIVGVQGAEGHYQELSWTMDELETHFKEQQEVLWNAGLSVNPQSDYELHLADMDVRFVRVPRPRKMELLSPAEQHAKNHEVQTAAKESNLDEDGNPIVPGIAHPDEIAVYLLSEMECKEGLDKAWSVARLNPATAQLKLRPLIESLPESTKEELEAKKKQKARLEEYEKEAIETGQRRVEYLNKLIAEHGPGQVSALIESMLAEVQEVNELYRLPNGKEDKVYMRAMIARTLADHRYYVEHPDEASKDEGWKTLQLPPQAAAGGITALGIFENSPEARHDRRAIVDFVVGDEILHAGIKQSEEVVGETIEDGKRALILEKQTIKTDIMRYGPQKFMKKLIDPVLKKFITEDVDDPDKKKLLEEYKLQATDKEQVGRAFRRGIVR